MEQHFYGSSRRVENFALSDGTTLTYAQVAAQLVQNVTLDGTAGADVLIGGSGHNTLRGKDGNDTLDGGARNDRLEGGNGNDLLRDRTGADTLVGGSGSDKFRFAELDGEVDRITDLGMGGRIELSGILSGYSSAQASAFLSVRDSGSSLVLAVDRDGQGEADGFLDLALIDGFAGRSLDFMLTNGWLTVG